MVLGEPDKAKDATGRPFLLQFLAVQGAGQAKAYGARLPDAVRIGKGQEATRDHRRTDREEK
jgi:hypothetical protein